MYVRVSTDGQTVENQTRELDEVASRHGWEVVEVFADEGISGAKGRDQRPAFDRLCMGIARREFDMVAAWSVDRLGRSLQDLVGFLGETHAKASTSTCISKASTRPRQPAEQCSRCLAYSPSSSGR